MAVSRDQYHYHFDEDQLIRWMFTRTYDNVTIKSQDNGFYYNIQVEPMDDMYHDYYIEYVAHVANPDADDKAYAKEFEDFKKQEAIRHGVHLQA